MKRKKNYGETFFVRSGKNRREMKKLGGGGRGKGGGGDTGLIFVLASIKCNNADFRAD